MSNTRETVGIILSERKEQSDSAIEQLEENLEFSWRNSDEGAGLRFF